MEHTAKFFVGQIVHHKKFGYRGVVFDVDATFQGTDEWYELVARSRPPKHMPWYHVLVEALLHESELARTDPGPQLLHRPMRYDIGRPSPVI